MTARGLPFWLLRLESARCPSCKRDNIWRTSGRWNRRRGVCRWCGASMVDWAGATKAVHDLAAAFGNFAEAARAVANALHAFMWAWYPTVWTVDVETATHDDLKAGNTATSISRVQVMAPDETEAKLVACQMATRPDRMPTRATVVDPRRLAAEAEEHRVAEAALRNPLAIAVQTRKLEEP